MLALAIAMMTACRGKAPPQPVAKPVAGALATKRPAQRETAPAPAQPVVLRRPAVEPLPSPVAVPKKKIGGVLKQAQLALLAGMIDERNLSSGNEPPSALNDQAVTSPQASGTQASGTQAPGATVSAASGDALALYRGVLTTDPANAAALRGMDALVAALYARAHAALAREDTVNAQRDADRLKLLRPDDPGLPELTAALNKGWRVAGLIERAQRLESAGSLISPRGANAAVVYRQALALAPGSAAADAGLARIEGVLIAKSLAEAEAARYPQSDRLIAQAATVRPDSQALQDASERIVAIREQHAAALIAEADAALKADEPDRAEQLLRQVERAAPLSTEAHELAVRIVTERNYGQYKRSQVFTDALGSAVRSPEMVVLPIGNFRMGSPDDEPGHDANESPQRLIGFKHGFAMSRTEITVEQFGRFVQAMHYRTDAERSGHSMIYDEVKGKLDARDGVTWRDDHGGKPAAPEQPVLHVSWNDAQAYTIWLSKETAHLYRLPSEAEFEYALRAGSTGAYPWPGSDPPKGVGNLAGSDPSPSGRHWGDAFAKYSDGYWGPAPVAHFTPNDFGLFDMIGNVSEWTQDCWHDSYRRAPENAVAWVNPGCTRRVVRGASWASSPTQARSAYRTSAEADSSSARVGFRVVREL
jgi:formylglycine-generating enzyme required for sulfatase activity